MAPNEYLDWRDGDVSTLWCYGKPGVGKTVITGEKYRIHTAIFVEIECVITQTALFAFRDSSRVGKGAESPPKALQLFSYSLELIEVHSRLHLPRDMLRRTVISHTTSALGAYQCHQCLQFFGIRVGGLNIEVM
ncbi:hypothetical protein PILCRDRAFT_494208 [Piloderma croceum F 1598]|uniref:Nephrocystin 3-like N-terminal domain-containing protein n=1 Tax=Piloderma croceum (strain F 1598) TaxID=765440 RepID=A0A0C3F9Z9_PILCF|nr:hypothetical protein PILCRDRAFT_494208 [Piloderma croceum F 1598]